jgi:vacuolar-type H+-ATPase subunit I/STV1
MTNVDTANTLTLIGAILSMVFGTIYVLWGIVQVIFLYSWGYWIGYVGIPWIIYGILSLIFGSLTLIIARKSLLEGDLKTGAIMCFIFGGITVAAIGGILAIVAGVLAIIAWNEQRRAAEVPPTPPPPPPPSQPTAAAVIYCSYCGAQLSPDAVFCMSCGKKVKK